MTGVAALEAPPAASIVATIAVGVLSLLLIGMVISDATTATTATGHVALFSPAHLALAGAGLALTLVAAAMLGVHWSLHRAGVWDWPTAGLWLCGGAIAGAIAAAASGLTLAANHGVPAGSFARKCTIESADRTGP